MQLVKLRRAQIRIVCFISGFAFFSLPPTIRYITVRFKSTNFSVSQVAKFKLFSPPKPHFQIWRGFRRLLPYPNHRNRMEYTICCNFFLFYFLGSRQKQGFKFAVTFQITSILKISRTGKFHSKFL